MDPISDLLEIAGEDDSLLSGGNGSTAADIFSCSPLVSIRSRPLQTAQPAEGIEITSVLSEDLTSSPKCSRPEASETQQSQQKKRKKKFGGFNLRKSLAWDRAFFTEQGVLNPTELSMISGTATPNSRSNLEVIDEEELATTSRALQEIEGNLFKHSSGGISIRAKKIGAVSGLSPKPGASVKRTPPVASLGKKKVLATNNVGNKYKRSAIPRAVPSSSIDTAKTPSKESKITRIPGPKSNVSANATTTRSGMLSSSSSKRNQNAHPGLSKNSTPSITSLPKNPAPSIPRLSKNPTPSIPSLSKNPMASIPRLSKDPTPSIPSLSKNPTPSIPHLSKDPTPSLPTNLSKNPKYVPSIPKVDMADKCSVSRTLTKQAGKLSDNSVSVPRPPSSMHQTGTIKSTGLRKPSPSIGFFSQVKASSSHSLQKSSIPCKPSESNILRKLETVSVKEAKSKIVKGAAKNTKELSLSDVKSEAIVQMDNKQMAVVEVECDSSSFEIVSKQAEVENILDDVILKSQEQGGLHENKIISSMENMALPTHGTEFLTKSQTHEQLEEKADHALGNKLYDVSSNGDRSLYQEPQSTLNPIMHRTSNTVQNAIGQDEDDQIKGPPGDIPTFKESLILQEEHGTSFKNGRYSGGFKGDNNIKTEYLKSSLDDFSKTVPEGSKQGTPCKNTEQVNYGADEFGRYGGDAQGHLLSESLTINCKKTTQSSLEAVSQQLQTDQPKTPNPSGAEENGPEKENISDMNCSQPVHVTTLFSKGSPEKSILGINGATEDESEIIEIQLPVNDQSGFIPRSPMNMECDQVIDSKTIHDRTPEFELDRLSEDCITVSASSMADDNIINEDSHLPGFQKPSAVVSVISQDVHLDSDFLPAVIVSPTELKDQNLVDYAFEGCGFHSNQHNATNHHIEDMPVNIDGNQDVDGKVELLQINDVEEKVEFLQVSDMDEKVEILQINNVDEKVELLQINGVEDGNHDVDGKVELLQINDVDEKVEFLQVSDMDEKVKLLQTNDVDEKVELLQINGIEDGNHDVDEKVEVLQINGAEDGNREVYVKVELLQINDVDEKVEFLQINDVDEKVELLQINDVDEKVEFSQINDVEDGNHDVDEKVELLQINDVDEKVELLQLIDVDEKVELLQINDVDKNLELLQINDVDEKVELLQINDVDEKVKLLQINDVDEKVEFSQINDVGDGNHDVDEKRELLQINDAEDGNHDVDEKVELLQISDAEDGNHDMDEKVELLQINGAEDRNRDVDEKAELLQINGAEDGNRDVDEKVEPLQINDVDAKVELLQINDVDEKVQLLQINDVEDGNHEVDVKVELLQINGAEDGSRYVEERVELLPINDAEEGLPDTSTEFDTSTEVSEDPFTTTVSLKCILSEKLKLLNSDMLVNNDGNQDMNEKVELLRINYAEEGSLDLSPSVEIPDMDEKVELLRINGEEEASLDISPSVEIQDMDEKVELLGTNGAEEGSLDISPSVEIQLENVISAEFDSSTEVSEDPCLLSEKSKLLASENLIFNATIPHGSEVSSVKLNESATSGELDSYIEVSEGPCLLSEKSKLLASENSIFYATIPQGSEVCSMKVKLNENAISAELDSSIEVIEEGPCLLREKSELVASENSIFNATITQGSKVVSSMKFNENAISAELDSSIEVSEGPLSENSKLLASENSIFNATIPQGSEVSSVKLNENATAGGLDSSIEMSEGHFTSVVAWKPEEQCLLSQKSKLLASDNLTFIETIPQCNEVSTVNSESFSDVAVTTVVENDKSPNIDMLSQTKNNIDFTEDNSKTIHIEIDATKTKQEVPIVAPPLNVAPFTEEWLAAMEAAGEEILTMKSGAVQNSPPDKVQNEPNPWSPVKKNLEIGPFDCTKITKHNIQSSVPL